MASGLVEQRSARAVLGWEWAPPPPPEPSSRRQLEPQRPQAQRQLPPPASSGMDDKTKAYLMLGGGGLMLLLAISSAGLLVLALPLLAYGGYLLWQEEEKSKKVRAIERSNVERERDYEEEHRRWCEAIAHDESEERRRFDEAPRWYPIERLEPSRRLDVFGGEPEGWASLIHTAFAGLVRTGPATVLDLTRRNLAQRALWPDPHQDGPRSIVMPAQLARFDPLVGTRHPGEVAALLISSENPNEDWARRDVEMGILRRLTDVLGEDVTLPRLVAAVTALLAPETPLVSEQLSAQERGILLDPGFVVMLGNDFAAHLSRLAAALDAIVRGSERAEPGLSPAVVPFLPVEGATVIATGNTGGHESRRRLDNLLGAALVDRMSNAVDARGLVLVVGADRLSRPVIEGLAENAQESGLRLALLFEDLGGPAREVIGRGASDTILMRLGNHEDALTGANFIGKEHRFVVSSITLGVGTQLGGSDNHGFSVTDSDSYTDQKAGPDSRTSGRSVGSNFSYGRTWSETENYGETSTRSEEFLTRAEDLQRIPTTGFIFVTAVDGRRHVIVGDCHPAIAESPLVAPRAIARR